MKCLCGPQFRDPASVNETLEMVCLKIQSHYCSSRAYHWFELWITANEMFTTFNTAGVHQAKHDHGALAAYIAIT